MAHNYMYNYYKGFIKIISADLNLVLFSPDICVSEGCAFLPATDISVSSSLRDSRLESDWRTITIEVL